MALNFRIMTHRNSDNLHLKLIGNFDSTSAYELLEVIEKDCPGNNRVVIHTSCLERIHSTGLEVFRHNISELNNQLIRLIFTGDHAAQLAPEGSKFY